MFTAVWALGGFNPAVVQAAETTAAPAKPSLSSLNTDPHLVGWWKLDDTTGNQLADSSPQAHAGTLGDGARSVPGRIGQAVQSDGNNQGIVVAGFKGVTGTQPRTIAAWIKTGTPEGEIVSWGFDDHGKMLIFGHIRGHVGVTPKGGYLYMKAGTADNQWHHVAVVVREASPPNLHDDVKLYKDGQLAEIDDIGLLDLYPLETGDQLDVRLGRRFKGCLDDLRIYSRALSADEVKFLFTIATP